MQYLQGSLPVTLVNQVIPVRNDIVNRTALVAKGNAAIHTARALLAYVILIQRDDKFVVMLDAIGSRCIATIQPFILEETGWFTHT